MLTVINHLRTIKSKELVEIACLSTDTKPTDCANGSVCIEIDTGSIFMYDDEGEQWTEVAGA